MNGRSSWRRGPLYFSIAYAAMNERSCRTSFGLFFSIAYAAMNVALAAWLL